MAGIDFITALGRVLQDGALRDAFAADPPAMARRIGLRGGDELDFARLNPADLERQACVLLRKRFDVVRPALPRTIEKLGDEAWPVFQHYARTHWPAGMNRLAKDAFAFCQHLLQSHPRCLCPLERNRARFACRQCRFAAHWIAALPAGGKRRPGAQFLLRLHSDRWHEWIVWLHA